MFRISVGELLDNRYKSYAFTGKGVFSNVIRCKDKQQEDKAKEDVAIKIIRKNELMHKAGKSFLFPISSYYLVLFRIERSGVVT